MNATIFKHLLFLSHILAHISFRMRSRRSKSDIINFINQVLFKVKSKQNMLKELQIALFKK